jgi:hypothetical protein
MNGNPSRGERKKEPLEEEPFKNNAEAIKSTKSSNASARRRDGYEWLFR